MIPSDLAARLRMLSEASFFDSEPPVQGTARIREIQARLPDLLPGQRFTATLQRNLPDGTFQAIVAGRSYTLSLNHAAKTGDTLELVVTQSTPRAVFAQLAAPPAGAAPEASRPTLSPTGRLISFLLTGQPASQPAALGGGKPLVDAPPAAGGAVLAPALRQALSQSGLFYESHQNQWLAGKIETATLLREPQGQESPARQAEGFGAPLAGRAGAPAQGSGLLPSQATSTAAQAAGLAPQDAAEPARAGAPVRPLGQVVSGTPENPSPDDGPETASSPAGTAQPAAQRMPLVPERLMPVVQQQLDALATQNYVWQGQVWPGQTVEWEIVDPEREGRGEGEEGASWNTTLRLTLPRLGGLEARLTLTPAGVALRLLADEPEAVAALEAARDRLDTALAAADVPLTGFLAERRDADG